MALSSYSTCSLEEVEAAGAGTGTPYAIQMCVLKDRSIIEQLLKRAEVNRPEDIELAINYGVDGIVISNHGGRQLDGMPATINILRECAPIARGRIPLAIDGGIRRGSDISRR
ncbi:FMN-dependent dehydrogenase-domain-containing protein [Aspergillus heterothallicus]